MYQIKNGSLKVGNTLIEYIITGSGVLDHIIYGQKTHLWPHLLFSFITN